MKKILNFLLVLGLILGASINVFATETDSAQFEEILNSINKEYGLELEYVPFDASNVSVQEYEDAIRDLAKQQRDLLDHIAMREEQSINDTNIENPNNSRALITKTRQKDSWDGGSFYAIKAIYTIDTSTQRINLPSSQSYTMLIVKQYPTNTGGLSNISPATCKILDLGSTLSVKYTARQHLGPLSAGNITIYAEFYYDD